MLRISRGIVLLCPFIHGEPSLGFAQFYPSAYLATNRLNTNRVLEILEVWQCVERVCPNIPPPHEAAKPCRDALHVPIETRTV